MISLKEEEYIIEKAYVPEHIVSLMVEISKGEPFFYEDYVFLVKDDWLIFVGYPLDHNFTVERFSTILKEVMGKFQPAYTWFIAPEVPASLSQAAQERESDYYYKLDIQGIVIKKDLRRIVRKASQSLSIERSHRFSKEHTELMMEFLKRENLPPRVKELFHRMPEYIQHGKTSLVLSAWNQKKNLSAFYIIELAAKNFATYVVGSYSQKNYIAHASDLLFSEMINLAKENHKNYIHLGLGVDEGIRRFKNKWGGIPFLKYEFCTLSSAPRSPLSWIGAMEAKL